MICLLNPKVQEYGWNSEGTLLYWQNGGMYDAYYVAKHEKKSHFITFYCNVTSGSFRNCKLPIWPTRLVHMNNIPAVFILDIPYSNMRIFRAITSTMKHCKVARSLANVSKIVNGYLLAWEFRNCSHIRTNITSEILRYD